MNSSENIEINEQWLVARVAEIAEGNRAAFDDLYTYTISRMLAFARRLMQDDHLAEDCVAETYVRVWKDAAKYSPERAPVLAWLYTICRTRGLDLLRAGKRHQPVSETILVEALEEGAICDETEAMITAFDADSTIYPVLLKLTPAQRQLIGLAFFRGLSHSEIASTIGMPIGTVKSHIHRALVTMREELRIA